MLITQDMIDFIVLLKRHRVKYAVVGGFAVILYGNIRTTQDLDFLIYPSQKNARKMIRALEDFGFGGVGLTQDIFTREGTAIHLGAEPNRIDILTSLKDASNDLIFSHLRRIRYKGLTLNVISRKDLMTSKRHSTRLKDRADVEILEKTTTKKNLHHKRRSPQ